MHVFARSTPIFVAGHSGLVGSALVRKLESEGFERILTADRAELDLRDGPAVARWFTANQPKLVFVTAGTGGGLLANSDAPADFLIDNLSIASSVLSAAKDTTSVSKLIYLSPANVYPGQAHQPIAETELLAGPLELANRSYALAKIAGIEMCRSMRQQYGRNFIAAVATNTYGPGDAFDERHSTVVPGLIRRFVEAKRQNEQEVTVWGSGRATRDFLFVDDLADALLYIMTNYDRHEHINIGSGVEVSISDLAHEIAAIAHPTADIRFDTTRPEGTPRMHLDVSKLDALGWRAQTALADGLQQTIDHYETLERD